MNASGSAPGGYEGVLRLPPEAPRVMIPTAISAKHFKRGFHVDLVLGILVAFVIQWAILMVVIPIAGRIAGFSFPGFKFAAGRLAVVVLATSIASAFLSPVSSLLAWAVSLVIFWVAMVKWFDVDLMGAAVICVVNFFVQMGAGFVLAAIAASSR